MTHSSLIHFTFAEVSGHSVPGRPGTRQLTSAGEDEGGEQVMSE